LRRGAVGEVWEAEDRWSGWLVEVEMLSGPGTSDSAWVSALRDSVEHGLWPRFEHPNLQRVFEFGEDKRGRYLVMDRLDGETLDQRLNREKRLPPAEAVRVGMGVAEGLAALHPLGLGHGALSPEHVMLTPDRGVKLLDFQ